MKFPEDVSLHIIMEKNAILNHEKNNKPSVYYGFMIYDISEVFTR